MTYKKWCFKSTDKNLAQSISKEFNISPLVSLLLSTRGCSSVADAQSFLSGDGELSDPFEITDMEKACEVIRTALDNGDKICVFGDYDADGVTSCALLSDFLESQGGDVMVYIPNRENDGYGMSCGAVDKLHEEGVKLIVTVDNGISAVEEAKYVKKLGMSLVICDHHQCGDVLPEADAVVDPQRDDLPFKDWAGVGVAFKLATALNDGYSDDLLFEYADLVAIGTVADIVTLTGENRSLVKFGLKMINKNQRIGLSAFREVTSTIDKKYSSSDLGFLLAPRINAAGRLSDAFIAYDMLVSDDYSCARVRVQELCELNSIRQGMVSQIINDIMEKISDDATVADDRIIVVGDKSYHKGVIGIVASRLVEIYGKPCVVFSQDEEGVCSASCRSIVGFSIYDALSKCSDVLLNFGGHQMAAGIGFEIGKLKELRCSLNTYYDEKLPEIPVPVLEVDCEISMDLVTLETENEIAILEPFGNGSPQPIFAIMGMKLISVVPMGQGKHLKISAQKDGKIISMVYFSVSENQLPFEVGSVVDIAFKMSKNYYNDKISLSIQIVAMRSAEIEEEKYFAQMAMWNSISHDKNIACSIDCVVPNREKCSAVYRFLVAKKSFTKSFDALFFSLHETVNYVQLKLCIKAFEELGLINCDDGGICVNSVKEKVDLMNAPIFLQMKSRHNYEN